MTDKLISIVVGIGAILAGLLATFKFGKREAKLEIKQEETEAALERAVESRGVVDEVSKMSDADLDDELNSIMRDHNK